MSQAFDKWGKSIEWSCSYRRINHEPHKNATERNSRRCIDRLLFEFEHVWLLRPAPKHFHYYTFCVRSIFKMHLLLTIATTCCTLNRSVEFYSNHLRKGIFNLITEWKCINIIRQQTNNTTTAAYELRINQQRKERMEVGNKREKTEKVTSKIHLFSMCIICRISYILVRYTNTESESEPELNIHFIHSFYIGSSILCLVVC